MSLPFGNNTLIIAFVICNIPLLEFNRAVKASDTLGTICVVYRKNATGKSITRKWFYSFKMGNFDINGSPRPRKSSEFNKDSFYALIYDYPCLSTQCEII